MLSPVPEVLLIFSGLLGTALGLPSMDPVDLLARAATPSPDMTCGVQAKGTCYCPESAGCCSSSGYCGSTDKYCLSSAGCQSKYSPPNTNYCYAPTDKVTVSPDNTCGITGAGLYGYRCPTYGLNCCSSYGYCGNTTAFCDHAENGCQTEYGYCRPEGA